MVFGCPFPFYPYCPCLSNKLAIFVDELTIRSAVPWKSWTGNTSSDLLLPIFTASVAESLIQSDTHVLAEIPCRSHSFQVVKLNKGYVWFGCITSAAVQAESALLVADTGIIRIHEMGIQFLAKQYILAWNDRGSLHTAQLVRGMCQEMAVQKPTILWIE